MGKKYRLVVADEDKYAEHEVEARRRGVRLAVPNMKDEKIDRMLMQHRGVKDIGGLKKLFGKKKGEVHAEAIDEDCPDGEPNCRNCGDPNFLDDCRSKGHCEHCIEKRHGIGPDCDVEAAGLVLEEVVE